MISPCTPQRRAQTTPGTMAITARGDTSVARQQPRRMPPPQSRSSRPGPRLLRTRTILRSITPPPQIPCEPVDEEMWEFFHGLSSAHPFENPAHPYEALEPLTHTHAIVDGRGAQRFNSFEPAALDVHSSNDAEMVDDTPEACTPRAGVHPVTQTLEINYQSPSVSAHATRAQAQR